MNALETNLRGGRNGPGRFAGASGAVLGRASVAAVSVTGGLGCGKTTLIARTVERLMPRAHVGLVTCDPAETKGVDCVSRTTDQVVRVNRGSAADVIDERTLRDALHWLDLNWLDLLFIEQPGPTLPSDAPDHGQVAAVAMFSVPAGHDVAARHPELVRSADLVVLNKVDLCAVTPFDLKAFRADVARLNPAVRVIELCATSGMGMDRWLEWLRSLLGHAAAAASGLPLRKHDEDRH